MALLFLACAVHDLRAVPPDATVDADADGGPHDDAQSERWGVHARLHDVATDEPLDLFAGFAVQRTDLDRVGIVPVPLGVNPFHAASVRVATPARAWTARRHNFPVLFSAGIRDGGVFQGDWRLIEDGGTVVLAAGAGPVHAELRMTRTRAPTLPGESGRVRIRGASRLWVQEEAMAVRGRWVERGRVRRVEGTAFLKHEWGRLRAPGLDGFEWFSADLPDGTSLSVGWLADDGRRGVPGSLAWTATPDGVVSPIDPAALRITPTRDWTSPRSGARWPVAWTVQGAGLDLVVEAERDDQEIPAFPGAIWAGPTRITGTLDGGPVAFAGLAEQRGPTRALYVSDPPPGEVAPAPSLVEATDPLVPWTLQLGAEIEE